MHGVGGLRSYLSELTPQARALLVGEFERRVAMGDAEIKSSVILQELRALAPAKPLDQAALLFYRPLEPFLVDDTPERRHPGRLSHGALAPLWHWLASELMPEAIETYLAQANEALGEGEVGTAEALARALQDRAVVAIRSAFGSVEEDNAQRAILAGLSTPRPRDDIEALRWILRGRDMLAKLAAELPERIDDLDAEQVEAAIALIESTARPRDIFPFALVTVMKRLAQPHQLVRLAMLAAGSRSASRMADTEYGLTLTILLAELERLIGTLSRAIENADQAAAAAHLKHIDNILRGLRAEIVIPVASSLGRQLDGIAAEAAALGRAALGSLHRMAETA